MRRISVLTLAVLLVAAASPVLAAEKGVRPQAEAPGAYAPPTADDAKLMSGLTQARAPYQALLLSSEEFLGEVLGGAHLVLGSPTPPAAADLAAWKTRMLAGQAQLRAQRAAMPAFPSSQFARLRAYPDGARILAGFEKFPKAASDAADNALLQSERIIPLVEKVAAGDAGAREQLQKIVIDGAIAALQAENALLNINTIVSGEAAPQTALSRSMVASNNALVDFYEMLKAGDDEARLKALVVKMAADLNEGESQANKIGPLARFAFAQSTGLSPDLKSRIEASLPTYDESAKVELQLIALFRQIMSKIADDPDGAQALAQEIGPLVNRRIELNNQRNRLIGG